MTDKRAIDAAWAALDAHRAATRDTCLRDLLAAGAPRFEKFSARDGDLLLDFSKTAVTAQSIELLVALARATGVTAKRDAMFAGAAINTTENRPALHVALRMPADRRVEVAGVDVMPGIAAMLHRLAAFADGIAYNAHDFDDGLRAGLFPLEEVIALLLVGPIFKSVLDRYPGIERTRLIHESLRRLIAAMVDDVIVETHRRWTASKPGTAQGVRALGKPLVGFSETVEEAEKAIRTFLFARMYRHTRVNRMTSKARRVVKDLFSLLLAEPALLPDDWRDGTEVAASTRTARRVADYIAGMTDRFALDEHSRLFDPSVKP